MLIVMVLAVVAALTFYAFVDDEQRTHAKDAIGLKPRNNITTEEDRRANADNMMQGHARAMSFLLLGVIFCIQVGTLAVVDERTSFDGRCIPGHACFIVNYGPGKATFNKDMESADCSVTYTDETVKCFAIVEQRMQTWLDALGTSTGTVFFFDAARRLGVAALSKIGSAKLVKIVALYGIVCVVFLVLSAAGAIDFVCTILEFFNTMAVMALPVAMIGPIIAFAEPVGESVGPPNINISMTNVAFAEPVGDSFGVRSVQFSSEPSGMNVEASEITAESARELELGAGLADIDL